MGDKPERSWTAEERRLAHQLLPYLDSSGWLESCRRRESVDRDGEPIPWIAYPALNFIEPRVSSRMSVFEFGSGNSTLWWARRAGSVASVEHDPAWAAKVAERVPSNVELSHVPLEPGGDYCRQARESGRSYHVIVVDGRDRVACAMSSVEALDPDGVVVWDNTERNRYRPGIEELLEMGFRQIAFRGLAPIGTWETETSVFYRTSNCLGI